MPLKDEYHRWPGSEPSLPPLPPNHRTAALSLTGEGDAGLRLYEDCGDYAAIKAVFEELLALYNAKKKGMTLVFFEDALEHLTRIHRAIRLPQGNALLVGAELAAACLPACLPASYGTDVSVHWSVWYSQGLRWC